MIKSPLLVGLLLVGGCVQQSCVVSANDCVKPILSGTGEPPDALQIHTHFFPRDLKRFKSLPGCEWDDAGVRGCSVTGSHGEEYLIFEGNVVRVDVEVADLAFKFCEFAGLTAQSSVEDVQRWAKDRRAEVVSGSPPDAPDLFSVLAIGFVSRWCAKDCDAAFSFFPDGHLQTVRIMTHEPYF